MVLSSFDVTLHGVRRKGKKCHTRRTKQKKNRLTAWQLKNHDTGNHISSHRSSKTAIIADKEAENPVNAARSVQVMPRTGSQALKKPPFNWKTADKYQEL